MQCKAMEVTGCMVYIRVHLYACMHKKLYTKSICIHNYSVCMCSRVMHSVMLVCMYVCIIIKLHIFFKNASSVFASSSELYTDQGSIY